MLTDHPMQIAVQPSSPTPKSSSLIHTNLNTPVRLSRGSENESLVIERQSHMATNLRGRSYESDTLLDKFLENAPVVLEEQAEKLRQTSEWNIFMAKSTQVHGSQLSQAGSNEEEFRALVERVAAMDGLKDYFQTSEEHGKPANPDAAGQEHIRLSH